MGAPEKDNETGELKLFTEVTVMKTVPESPCMTLRVLGEKSIVNVSRSWALTKI